MNLRSCPLILLLTGVFALPVSARFLPLGSAIHSTNFSIKIARLTQDSTLVNKAERLQDSLSSLQQLPTHYLTKITSKNNLLNARLTRHTAKALRRLKKQEENINRKLSKIDSVAAHNLFATSVDSLSHLQEMVKGKITRVTSRLPGGKYIPHLDSLTSSLKFLNKYKTELGQVKGLQQKLQGSLGSVHQLEGKLDQVQDIQQYIQQREQLLTKALSGYGQLFSNDLGKISREVSTYKAQLQNYKQLWQHPDQVEAKALALLNKMLAFKTFMEKNSMLASLFRLPSDYGTTASLQRLQVSAQKTRVI